MIEKERHIKELYDLKHRKDKFLNDGFDYENNLVSKIFSNVMFGNPTLNNFMGLLQKNMVWMIESTLVIKNWWNYTVDKHSNHNNN